MVHLRSLQADSLAEASRLCLRAKAYWGYSEGFLAACMPGLTLTPQDLESSLIMGAFDVERLVGVAQIAFDGRDCLLDKLFVDPGAIGMGIGRQLFDWCRHEAAGHRSARLLIESDPFAEPIYLAMGCHRIGRVWSEPTSRHIPLLEFPLSAEPNAHSHDSRSPHKPPSPRA